MLAGNEKIIQYVIGADRIRNVCDTLLFTDRYFLDFVNALPYIT